MAAELPLFYTRFKAATAKMDRVEGDFNKGLATEDDVEHQRELYDIEQELFISHSIEFIEEKSK